MSIKEKYSAATFCDAITRTEGIMAFKSVQTRDGSVIESNPYPKEGEKGLIFIKAHFNKKRGLTVTYRARANGKETEGTIKNVTQLTPNKGQTIIRSGTKVYAQSMPPAEAEAESVKTETSPTIEGEETIMESSDTKKPSLESVFKDHKNFLYKKARQLTGKVSGEDKAAIVTALVENVEIALCKNYNNYDPQIGSLLTWIEWQMKSEWSKMAKHHACGKETLFRNAARDPTLLEGLHTDNTVERQVVMDDLYQHIHDLARENPDVSFVLHKEELGLSTCEAADKWGYSRTKAQKIIKRAQNTIKAHLSNTQVDEFLELSY